MGARIRLRLGRLTITWIIAPHSRLGRLPSSVGIPGIGVFTWIRHSQAVARRFAVEVIRPTKRPHDPMDARDRA